MKPRATPQVGATHLEREVGHGVAHRQSEVPMSPARQIEMGHDTPIPRLLMGREHRLAQSPTMSVVGGRHPSQPAADAQHFIGYVETTTDALRLIIAARQGIIPRITRKLNDSERRVMIKSGAVFVFCVEESGIKRWTEGLSWSPSRIMGNFLVCDCYPPCGHGYA